MLNLGTAIVLPILAIIILYGFQYESMLPGIYHSSVNGGASANMELLFPIQALLFRNGNEKESIWVELNREMCDTDMTMGALFCSRYNLHDAPCTCELFF